MHDLVGKPVSTFPDHALEPEPRPHGARLERRNQVLGKSSGKASPRNFQAQYIAPADPKHAAAEKAAVGRYQGRNDLVAKSFAQNAAQIADSVDEAEFQSPPSGPVLA